jgi:RNA polymerase sigma factor for flagellar operon FliA
MTSIQHAISTYATAPDEREIVRRFGHIVRRHALVLAARTRTDADDLWAVGALGLIEAFRRYDPSRGVTLETFVGHRVRGAMLDELRRVDRLPRRTRGKVGMLAKKKNAMSHALGRAPTRDELAKELDIEPAEVDRLAELAESERPLESAPEPVSDYHVDELLISHEHRAALTQAIGKLNERYQTVLSLRYVEELTLREIAGILNVSEPRVCQLHNAALAKLRIAMGLADR